MSLLAGDVTAEPLIETEGELRLVRPDPWSTRPS